MSQTLSPTLVLGLANVLVAEWEQMILMVMILIVFAQAESDKIVPSVFLSSPCFSVCGALFMGAFIYNMAVRKGRQFNMQSPLMCADGGSHTEQDGVDACWNSGTP